MKEVRGERVACQRVACEEVVRAQDVCVCVKPASCHAGKKSINVKFSRGQ